MIWLMLTEHAEEDLGIGRRLRRAVPGDRVRVRAGAQPARIVTFDGGDFYRVLRSKFNLADR